MAMTSLRATGLRKTFPGVVALDGVDLALHGGSVHALIGANGAGKSTLIKILTGYYDAYEGRIEINGRPVAIRRPADAFRAGIEVVHQEVDTTLVPYLSAAENLLIEQLAAPGSGLFIRKQVLYRQAQQIVDELGLEIDVRAQAADLSLPQKQLLVIARAVSRRAPFLILDEPTAALSIRDAERLFEIMRELKQRGVAFLYVSHRLAEIQEIADEVTVLRNGQKVAHFVGEAFDIAKGVEAMLGAPPGELYPKRQPAAERRLVMEVRGLCWGARLKDISFDVYQGEVLGIAGLTGAGKTELLRVLFGCEQPDRGEIYLNGKPVRFRLPKDAVRHGVYLIPEDRRNLGLLVEEPVRMNVTLPFIRDFSRLGFMRPSKEYARVLQLMDRLKLVPRKPDLPAKHLSGGNQQKVVVGKWLFGAPAVILFDEATQGIDVGAKRELYAIMRELARSAAVIFASSDIDEVLGVADRVLVMRDGQFVGEFEAEQADRQAVMRLAASTVHVRS
jgi:simple sugar transport system ATP-binding protein